MKTEDDVVHDTPTPVEATPSTTPSGSPAEQAGRLIRNAREQSGLHIAALSVALKVPVAKLEALEAGRLEELPGLAFTRSLALSICRHLKIDAADVLQMLPTNNTSSSPALTAVAQGMNTPFRQPNDHVTLASTWEKLKKTVLTVLVLLVAALGIYVMPESWLNKKVTSDSTATSTMATPGAKEVQETVSPLGQSASSAPLGAASEAYQGNEVVTVVVPASTSAISTPQLAVATPSSSSSAASVAAVMSLQVSGDSWIEVQDRDKRIVFRRLMKSGESEQIQGSVPLTVSIGNAQKTQVQVRGQAFDLTAVTRDNIARFNIN